jgi:translation initiation factor 1
MKRGKQAAEPATAPFHNPFGSLEKLKRDLPAAATPEPRTAVAPAQAVIRIERKGRGGKEVTVVEQLELSPDELQRWLAELKQLLGCGGALKEGALLLQGDQRRRVKEALVARGVRRIRGA